MPIEIINLSHSYKEGTPFEHKVLHDIDLNITDGEFVGLIGPTRSGKSTLAQHLNALYIPHRGKVFIDGLDTSNPKADLIRLRHKVGYVFQNPDYQLFAPTVAEDIAFGPTIQRLTENEIKERVLESMNQVGLDYGTFCKRDIFALSGGQKRRTAIAGVLACKPQILVLDDITAGLDPGGREDILGVISSLHKTEHITIIFISNSMDEIADLAERIIVMNEGRIIMDGPARQIFSRTDELNKIGLELPEITRIMDRLQLAGYRLPKGVLNIHDAIAYISTAIREQGADD
ncbi:MAG: energy-coupling factor transporter ATPase [Bacillota bacterium]|nr:energy-coupling factor transporter ATPase [Bacillota bacterium]